MVFFAKVAAFSALVATALARPEIIIDENGEMFDTNPSYNFEYQVADDAEQTYITQSENRQDGEVTGRYSYVDPTGSLIVVTYTAGADGYSEEREVQDGFVQIRSKPTRVSSTSSTSTVGGSSSFGTGSLSTTSTTSSNSGSTIISNRPVQPARPVRPSRPARPSVTSSTSSTSSNSGNLVSTVTSAIRPVVQQVVTTETSSTGSGNNSDLVARIIAQLTPFIQSTVSNSLNGQQQQQVRTTTTRRVSSSPFVRRIVN